MTPDDIDAMRTTKGGWTRDQLAAWGVPWPPPKGWKATLAREPDAAAIRALEKDISFAALLAALEEK